MNIIKRPTINDYKRQYPEAAIALEEWYQLFRKTGFKTPQELKAVYGNASIVGNSRVVFNIHGNKYRLVVKIRYDAGIAYVIWFGTHAAYDEIDVETVGYVAQKADKKDESKLEDIKDRS